MRFCNELKFFFFFFQSKSFDYGNLSTKNEITKNDNFDILQCIDVLDAITTVVKMFSCSSGKVAASYDKIHFLNVFRFAAVFLITLNSLQNMFFTDN